MTVSSKVFNNLVKNSSMMFLLNVAGAGVSVITIPVMLAIVGVESYGHLVLVQSIALAVFTVCGFQYWQGMLVAMPGHKIDAATLRVAVVRSLRYEMLAMAAVILVVAGLTLFSLPQLKEFSTVNLLLLSLAAVFPVIGTHTAYFRLVNQYKVLMYAGFLANLLKLLVLVVVSRYQPTLSSMVLAYTLPEVIRCVVLFVLIFRNRSGIDGALPCTDLRPARLIEAGKWGTLQAICDLPVAQLDRIIIGLTLPGYNLGVFSILKRIYSLVNMATAPFYSTSIPEFAACANAGDLKGAFELWIKTMKMLFVVTASAGAICYLSKFIWMPLVFPVLQDYVLEFAVVLLTAVMAGTFVTTHSFYWALGKLRQSTIISVGTNLLYLLELSILTMYFGLFGAVLSFLIHVTFVAAIKIILLRKIALRNQ
ncbi:polysaccharide biosynthesis protein [Janthinobacterium sp. HH104]|uniref:Membrane protein involved in the export of O-antigen and teichoic acid n=1 Tax=Janthinobacterium lividum TaxID=29581 RepID=A0AB38C922_9BURK|nr:MULTISPECIES: oligosaccharide flippase family protein [Janthinobacterium]EZP39610.1 Polysaccharide biosynthesis protein domain-containing protein [Janthinobacterium lividum]OEZ81968.1 polysaccharide biosynthesis protein [Janthinobacterium sp. HH104]SFX68792.1 Membrane protein involved in the export of O-antigen and teichoic acid [Janthinobacterium lividum]